MNRLILTSLYKIYYSNIYSDSLDEARNCLPSRTFCDVSYESINVEINEIDRSIIDSSNSIGNLPSEVLSSFQYYYGNVEVQDWGCVRVYNIQYQETKYILIRVTTDGDDSFVEVYDDNKCILSARGYLELLTFTSTPQVLRACATCAGGGDVDGSFPVDFNRASSWGQPLPW